jgi:microcompartment protein CcmL/EutN
VVASIGGVRRGSGDDAGEALGVVETATVSSVIRAADAGVKAARVAIRELRLADDLGGKGYVLFGGAVAEVEAAVEAGRARVGESRVADLVIAQLHDEMRENLDADARFAQRVRGATKDDSPRRAAGPPSGGRPLPGTGGPPATPPPARTVAKRSTAKPVPKKSAGAARRTRTRKKAT